MSSENDQAVITSGRLLFRRHQPGDLDAFCAMEQDPDVRRYVGGAPRTCEAAEQRFLKGLEQPAAELLRMWATVLKEDGSYIGRCGIYQHLDADGKAIPGVAALGLYIAKNYWGRGFATEAGQALIHFGFENLNINRIVTAVQVGNDASVRVIEKLGFILVETEIGPRSFYHFALEKKITVTDQNSVRHEV